jgi:hypothetical protein
MSPKGQDTIRKEVHLSPEVVSKLEKIAKKENRSLKNLMEFVLIKFVEKK